MNNEKLNEVIDNLYSFTLNEDEEIVEEEKEQLDMSYPLNALLSKWGDKAFDLLSLASQLYAEADNDINMIPDFEATNDYIYACSRSEYNAAVNAVKKAITNVGDNIYNGNIELSDRATFNALEAPEDVDGDQAQLLFGKLRDQAFEEFERITGVEIWQDGRMGRHIVVENTFSMAYNYDKLCEVQEEQEDWVINTFNEEVKDLL